LVCAALVLAQVLKHMGLNPEMEHITADKLFSVDMVIHLGGYKLAIEANGPSHYTATQPPRLLGNKVRVRAHAWMWPGLCARERVRTPIPEDAAESVLGMCGCNQALV